MFFEIFAKMNILTLRIALKFKSGYSHAMFPKLSRILNVLSLFLRTNRFLKFYLGEVQTILCTHSLPPGSGRLPTHAAYLLRKRDGFIALSLKCRHKWLPRVFGQFPHGFAFKHIIYLDLVSRRGHA